MVYQRPMRDGVYGSTNTTVVVRDVRLDGFPFIVGGSVPGEAEAEDAAERDEATTTRKRSRQSNDAANPEVPRPQMSATFQGVALAIAG